MSKVIAIVGTYRRGGTIDTVCDQVLEGARSAGARTEKVLLIEKNLHHCRNCFACFRDREASIGRCVQEDDMRGILERIVEADGVLLASPVNCGSVTALMKVFIERSAWTMARPEGRFLWLRDLPQSRLSAGRRAVVVTSAGAVPRYLAPLFCYAQQQLVDLAVGVYRADLVGTLFLGSVLGRRPTAGELSRARQLGIRLATPDLAPLDRAATRVRTALAPVITACATLVQR